MQNAADAKANAFVGELLEQRNRAMTQVAEMAGNAAAMQAEYLNLNDRLTEALQKLDEARALLASYEQSDQAVLDAN